SYKLQAVGFLIDVIPLSITDTPSDMVLPAVLLFAGVDYISVNTSCLVIFSR
ncbi:MAG: hypothetical protein RLZZ69_3090, partial [Cyanobacteriota bacterium]